MGRRRDSAEMQALKGSPGKRQSKAERAAAEAEAMASLLASSPAETDEPLSPPKLLHGARQAAALAVWRDYAPRLRKLNVLSALDRLTFSMFCVYAGEFVAAQQDIDKRGYTVVVKTYGGTGAARPFVNPSVKRRDTAFAVVMDIASKFGLTPQDRQKLVAGMAGNPLGGLFGGETSPKAPDAPHAPEVDDDIIGAATRCNSAPPSRLQ